MTFNQTCGSLLIRILSFQFKLHSASNVQIIYELFSTGFLWLHNTEAVVLYQKHGDTAIDVSFLTLLVMWIFLSNQMTILLK